MRLLCSTTNLAFGHSLRIALDGEDIETHCSDADMVLAGVAGPLTSGAMRIYLMNDEDWDRAVAVMEFLSPTPAPKAPVPAHDSSGVPKWLVTVAVATVVFIFAAALSD